MGFSPLGLLASVAVLAPNLLLLWFPPRDRWPDVRAPRVLGWLERVGQALCLVVPVIAEPGHFLLWWAIPAVVALLAYDALWVRYLVSGRLVAALYAPFWGIPVPMAVLPVVFFLAVSAWLGSPWIALSALVLAAGHIPVAVITGGAGRRGS